MTDTDSRRVSAAVALIDHEGEAQLMVLGEDDDDEPQFVLHGNVCCAGGFDDEIAGKRFLNDRNEEANVNLRIASGRLTGEFDFRRRDYTMNLGSSGEYGQALTLQSLAGVYTQTTTPLIGFPSTTTLTIDANGQLTGSHTNGCVINGSVSIPNVQRNMVRIAAQMSGCGSGGSSRQWNGSYDGLGLLLRNSVSPSNPSLRQDVFFHTEIGPTWLGPQSVGK